MVFTKESDFEEALIDLLSKKGWEKDVLKYVSQADLLRNWANILFDNNRGIDRLNDYPLTDSEMQQILEQITSLRTPLKLNGFINGKTVAITRDNPKDIQHLGKEISLKIYDRREIAAGQSRYQIVQQPQFKSRTKILNDRRGDLMLLINGMPVIHIELKKSGVSVSQAYNQIEKYSHEGIFTGIFSLIQVFVAMEPNETKYFANPGVDGSFNKDFYFHWADFNNEIVNEWQKIASDFLSIPMAHQLIGFYTVADDSDGILKVMRSYQYFAANRISDRVSNADWKDKSNRGGFIWHTTGSGKTMTSFKSAQLIANSKDADKVIFLMDRIELGTQSLREYQNFADASDSVQATENTGVLVTKLKSINPADTLIVTSIQKMSRIKDEDEGGLNAYDIETMSAKRIVFIVDEAHRSVFGDMLIAIRDTFPTAMFFGFTGTPIQKENQKKKNTTLSVFGDELHRYSIADGIRDKNVLGFDLYKVSTYKDKDLRREIALMMAKAKTEAEAINDSLKNKIYYEYMDSSKIKMASSIDKSGNFIKGIEDYLPKSQYKRSEHQQMVVNDILENFVRLSHNGKFHALFATSSIPEAIAYYRLLKKEKPKLKITALFDPTIDNNGGVAYKEEGLVEILEDYNQRFKQDFTMATHGKFKKDIAARLAHKKPYERIERMPEKEMDILIVVDQMLTGFDSKWINTLYMDKVLKYENIIQAFSRTNRLFGPDKPFGTIRYYRFPHTMKQNIDKAVKLYSGDKEIGLFVEQLAFNLKKMNEIYDDIFDLFHSVKIENFEKLPTDHSECGEFSKLFKHLNEYLEASKIQGFRWKKSKYILGKGKSKTAIEMKFDEVIYLTLVQRYKELFSGIESSGSSEEVPFEIDGYLTAIDTDTIDADYMNSRFVKYLKELQLYGIDEVQLQDTLDDLHKSFASLTQEEQKYANIFLHDIQSANVTVEEGNTFRECITEYQFKAKNEQIAQLHEELGVDEDKIREMMSLGVTKSNINEFGRFDELQNTVDKEKARAYFEKLEDIKISPFKLNIKIQNLLEQFIFSGGF